jgi:hypothetical protein
MKKRLVLKMSLTLTVALLSIGLMSCEMSAVSGSSATTKSIATTDSQLPEKISGTAGIGADAFFFEFDVSGTQKFARAFVPVSSDGFLKNGKILYNKERYSLTSFVYDPSSGVMAGSTATVAGVSYAFQGMYSNETGFIGNIKKTVKGEVQGGDYDFFSGVPVFAGKNFDNYIGYASFHFDSDTTALIFNALIDSDTGKIVGSWCETKPGVGNIHGTIDGVRSGETVTFTGTVWDVYKQIPGLYLDTMTADGEGWYKNSGEKTISGGFTIHWVGYDWYSDFAAVRVEN